MKWFQMAASHGHPRALFYMGECYEEGNGVAVDLKKAKDYYQQSAAKGYQLAKDALQRLEGKPTGPYAYTPPEGPKPAPQPPRAEKPKRGGLFGFFKKK